MGEATPLAVREPLVVREIVRLAPRLPIDRLGPLMDAIETAPASHVAAVGRARLIAQTFAMRLMQLGRPVHVVGDVTAPAMAGGDTLVAVSGTGETRTTLGVARAAVGLQARVIVLTAAPQSALARIAGELIVLPGAPRLPVPGTDTDSLQPPGSQFEQMLFCFLEETVAGLARRCDPDFTTIQSRHANLE